MRKVEQKMLDAIKQGKDFNSGNTRVSQLGDSFNVYLHGSQIAHVASDGTGWVSLCGWNTPTTRSRLNALQNFTNLGFFQKDYEAWLHFEVTDEKQAFNSKAVVNFTKEAIQVEVRR